MTQKMKLRKYTVAIAETHRREITVIATSKDDAQRRAYDGYMNTEIILGDDDYEGVEVAVLDDGQELDGTEPIGERVIDGYDAELGDEDEE